MPLSCQLGAAVQRGTAEPGRRQGVEHMAGVLDTVRLLVLLRTTACPSNRAPGAAPATPAWC